MPRVKLGQNTKKARKSKTFELITEIASGRKKSKKLTDTDIGGMLGFGREHANIMINHPEKLGLDEFIALGMALDFTAEHYAAIFATVATKHSATP